eukprot:gene2952-3886_t
MNPGLKPRTPPLQPPGCSASFASELAARATGLNVRIPELGRRTAMGPVLPFAAGGARREAVVCTEVSRKLANVQCKRPEADVPTRNSREKVNIVMNTTQLGWEEVTSGPSQSTVAVRRLPRLLRVARSLQAR